MSIRNQFLVLCEIGGNDAAGKPCTLKLVAFARLR
jgi:hypothetical protein